MKQDFKDEFFKLNAKIDHIGRIVSELFIMTKSNELINEKIDVCIKSLNNLNYKMENIEKNRPSFSLPPPPPPLPPQQQSSHIPPTQKIKLNYNFCYHPLNSKTNSYIDELKEKLKGRLIE
jgi:hypothetical protein